MQRPPPPVLLACSHSTRTQCTHRQCPVWGRRPLSPELAGAMHVAHPHQLLPRYVCQAGSSGVPQSLQPPPHTLPPLCLPQGRSLFPVEIIEVSCCLVDAHSLATRGEFQCYVRPTEHPRLDPFCTELTGITQAQVRGRGRGRG